jgi:hypothetical protein
MIALSLEIGAADSAAFVDAVAEFTTAHAALLEG